MWMSIKMLIFFQASRHQAHKNGTIFKVKVMKNAFFHGDEHDDDDICDSELRRINWKVFGQTWRKAELEQTVQGLETNPCHTFWRLESAKSQILEPLCLLESRLSPGFLLSHAWGSTPPKYDTDSLSSCSPQEEEYRDLVSISQSMEEQYGQYFDSVIPFEEVFVLFVILRLSFCLTFIPSTVGGRLWRNGQFICQYASNLSFMAKEVQKFNLILTSAVL